MSRRERFGTKANRSYPSREGDPPEMAFFEKERPRAGEGRVAVTLGPLTIALEGLEEPLATALRARYGPYVGDANDPVALAVDVTRDTTAYFIAPPTEPEFNPVWIACDGSRVRYCGYAIAGWMDPQRGRGAIVLGTGTHEPEIRAVENYLRCAVAWCAAERGGALVHGASAVRDGKAYLFFGESGAGKSTLAEVNRRATIVSDDLSLLLPKDGGGLDLVGSPFRGTYEGGAPVLGRFPLAAAFRIVKAPQAAVRPARRAVVFGQLVGNLAFVAEAFGTRPDLFERVEHAFAGVPLHHLEFRKDDSYWDAIDAAGL